MDNLKDLVIDKNNIVFHPMMGNSYRLNPIAKDIITLLREGNSKESLLKKLHELYDVDENELFIDVSDFFAKMKIYALLS